MITGNRLLQNLLISTVEKNFKAGQIKYNACFKDAKLLTLDTPLSGFVLGNLSSTLSYTPKCKLRHLFIFP